MNSKKNAFHKLFLSINYFIIFGITLVFSTATRSVFEVNKLAIVKVGICLLLILYSYDALFNNFKNFLDFKKNRFINSTLFILWMSNVLSTIFSQNIRISVFGSYDRWEGIITNTFYILFVFILANYKEKLFPKQLSLKKLVK